MSITDLERLKITDDIRNVMARYVRYADAKEWYNLAALFTPEGTFTPLNVAGEALKIMSGRANIAGMITTSVGHATAIHHLFSFEIDIQSSEEAKGIFSMEDYVIRPENEETVHVADSKIPAFRTLHGYGHYHGDFIKVDGAWYISKLVQTRLKLDFTY
jgi:hypothetical protein